MKIVIYNNLAELFEPTAGRLSELLRKRGHSCEVISLRRGYTMGVPRVDNIDLEIFFAGYTIFEILRDYPVDDRTKRVVWLFEPLTDSPLATHHSFKSEMFRQVSDQFHAVLAMDNLVAKHIAKHFPRKKLIVIPYPISTREITEPLAEEMKDIEVLWLARLTKHPRRGEAKDRLLRAGVKLEHVTGGLGGRKRDETLQRAKVSLQIHSDEYAYFDQFRIFNAWAKGSVIVSEPCINLDEYGVESGTHLILAELDDFPAVIKNLSSDFRKRSKIVLAAQDLLREYTMEHRIDQIEGFLLDTLSDKSPIRQAHVPNA